LIYKTYWNIAIISKGVYMHPNSRDDEGIINYALAKAYHNRMNYGIK
jgi:hypothetical protein